MGQMGILVFGIKKSKEHEATRLSVTTKSENTLNRDSSSSSSEEF